MDSHLKGNAGWYAALVVLISDDDIADGGVALSPTATNKAISERCLKYWPVSDKMLAVAQDNIPDILIAVVGKKIFRVMVGAWRVKRDKAALDHGVWEAVDEEGDVADLRGKLLANDIEFTQASRPVYLLLPDATQPVHWVGSRGSARTEAATADWVSAKATNPGRERVLEPSP
ncbi:hypothetical protein ATJ97_2333 [Georgenia soli]|uniref:Uncharacterized protein n=1 Tax=Georgenia soli TaxID=638953 RepID=A0A2A9ENI8_9MICO|nr:hypothetical protein [Georgenia soli]PFG39815.1 hypothetical protein ATJ97_2333 [Georgenia soli]